jgi:uncharacterized protein (TIGR02687 family)
METTLGSPSLEKLLIALYLTYFKRDLAFELPDAYSCFIARNSGNVTQIFQLLMSHSQKYAECADFVAKNINLSSILEKLPVDSIVKCSVFKEVDLYIIKWIISRLLNSDYGATVRNKTIMAICDERRETYTGKQFENDYRMLKNAALVLKNHIGDFTGSLDSMIKEYTQNFYKMDLYYRHFMESYDKLEPDTQYEQAQNMVENYYTNTYLSKYISSWNKVFARGLDSIETTRMRKFYSTFVKNIKKKTVVIISDALRYETAAELFYKFKNAPNCTSTINCILGELPSFTSLGMAALLPNKKLDITLNGDVFCDDKPIGDLAKREAILHSVNENSRCIQYNDLSRMKKEEIRLLLKGIDVLYVYHDQIDNTGEHRSEKDVFTACRAAIDELFKEVKYLGKSANVYHFVITADHGFIYKRDKLMESDKIGDVSKLGKHSNRRYILTDKEFSADGICRMKLGALLNNDNPNYVLFPESANVFKAPGGQNYVHGGSSPQELIVPVIDVDIERYSVETKLAEIRLNRSIKPKITNLIYTFDFLQTEAVTSEIKPAVYEIFIANDNRQIVSELHTVTANLEQNEAKDRLFQLTFNLKNQEYPKTREYYLIIRNKDTQIELSRTDVAIDIALSGDFGFF